ncbi:MAG TPA: zinc ribbon domain-containing protein, partial [Verrucomicrobiae bacterium]|nr:zinc ribbon domain-containing protein [Verrucomicrobiae bacterium]
MPICPNCGATVPDGAIACGNCGASLVSSQPQRSTSFQSQPNSSGQSSGSNSISWSGGSYDPQLSSRFQKALRRNELLSYAVIGLSVVLLIVIIVF